MWSLGWDIDASSDQPVHNGNKLQMIQSSYSTLNVWNPADHPENAQAVLYSPTAASNDPREWMLLKKKGPAAYEEMEFGPR